MGEPSVNQLLGHVASFSLPLATRQKAVEALQKTVTDVGFGRCTRYENISDGLPARVMACTDYETVAVYGFSESPLNPNSFILANTDRFSDNTIVRARTEIMKERTLIEDSVGRSLNCYIGDERYLYALVCENKVEQASYPRTRDFGPRW